MLNTNKFTFVNVCFQHKHNEVRGHYGQTLNKLLSNETSNTFSSDNSFDKLSKPEQKKWTGKAT
jgi:hypothetical protein